MKGAGQWMILCIASITGGVLSLDGIWMDKTIECMNSHGILGAKLTEPHTQKLTDPQENCVDACMFQSLELMKNDGSWNKEKFLVLVHGMSPGRIDQITKTCNRDSVGKGDDIEKACKVVECLKANEYFDEFHIRSSKSK